jgi:small GTP-binding protein
MDLDQVKTGSRNIKVVLLGDTSVGKTSLLSQFNWNTFQSETEPTVGAMFVAKEVATSRGQLNLLIWDTAGQERYRSLIPMYSRSAAAAVLVCDVASQSSYESIGTWYANLRNSCIQQIKVYVVANKIDLTIAIPIEKLESWAADNGFPFFRSCAAERHTVVPMFNRIADDFAEMISSITPPDEPVVMETKHCC